MTASRNTTNMSNNMFAASDFFDPVVNDEDAQQQRLDNDNSSTIDKYRGAYPFDDDTQCHPDDHNRYLNDNANGVTHHVGHQHQHHPPPNTNHSHLLARDGVHSLPQSHSRHSNGRNHVQHYQHQHQQLQHQLPPQQQQPQYHEDDGGYTDLDVLCEKGGRANQHFGNRVFLRLVQRNKQHFRELVKKQEKDMLIQSIILAIQQNGGRFRQRKSPSSAEWQTVPWERCYQKARQALREPDRKVHKAAVAANEAAAKAADAPTVVARTDSVSSTNKEQPEMDSKPEAAKTENFFPKRSRSESNASSHDSRSQSNNSIRRMSSRLSLPASGGTIIPEPAAARPSPTLRHDSLLRPPTTRQYSRQYYQHHYHHQTSSITTGAATLHVAHELVDAFEPMDVEESKRTSNTAASLEPLPAHHSPFRAPPHHHHPHHHPEEPWPLESYSYMESVPPKLQRNDTGGSVPGPPIETLLERQDSLARGDLGLAHLMEAAAAQREGGEEEEEDLIHQYHDANATDPARPSFPDMRGRW